MSAISLRRFFNRTKTLSPRLGKVALLSFVFFSVVVGNIAPVFAGTYDNFLNLFGPATDPNPTGQEILKPTDLQHSGIAYKNSEGVVEGKGVKKINFILGLIMKEDLAATPKKNVDYYWNHVAGGFDPIGAVFSAFQGSVREDTEAFLVRVQYKDSNGTTKTKIDAFTGVNHDPDTSSAGDQEEVTFMKKTDSGVVTNTFELAQQQLIKRGIDLGEYAPFGSQVSVDFWYCAGDRAEAGSSAPADGERIAKFPGYCGGTAYFKIGQTLTFTLPTSLTEATTQATATPATTTGIGRAGTENGTTNLPQCNILGSGSFMGCIARLVYYVIYTPIAWFAGLFGSLFDFFLGYSLDDASYRADFAVHGWKIVRDISNIFFIIILVWTGLATVLEFSNVSMKKVVPALIINALLINFSLFATRVVIDISNIVARVFYSTMTVCEGPCKDVDNDGRKDNVKTGPGGYKPLSEAIMSSFDPQKMFDANVLDSSKATPSKATSGVNYQADEEWKTAGYFIVVSLIAAALLFAIAMMFWKVAFFFLGRVIGLYLAMIFAPFAVLTRGGMPLLGGIDKISWKDWTSDLIKYATLAPIFVLFLYIIYSIIDSEFLKVYSGKIGGSFFETVIYIAIPMLIVYFLIGKGVKIASDYAGEMGKIVQNYANKAAGIAGGVALGGAAIVGNRTIGGLAKRLDESRVGSSIRNLAARGGVTGKIGRGLQQGLNATRTGSFDVRQTAIGKGVFKNMGVDTDAAELKTINKVANIVTLGATTGLGLSTAERAGGVDADIKRRQEDREKEAKLLEEKMSDEQIKKYNEKRRNKYEDKLERIIEEAMMEKTGKSRPELRTLKETNKAVYDTMRSQTLADPGLKTKIDAETAKVVEPVDVKSAAELTSARRKEFVKNLEKPSFIDRTLGAVPIVGQLIGSDVRKDGDKKAAKKIEEKTKVEKELAEIEGTLKKGFQDLIALDLFQGSDSFTKKLSKEEREDIVKYGSIQSGQGRDPKNVGKGMYDILDDAEKASVDADVKKKKDAMTRGTEDEKKKAKEEYEELEDLVKARESNKYDLKDLRQKLKNAKDAWIANPTDQGLKDVFREKLKEVKIAEKQQEKWRDINAYTKARRDKLKEEEKKAS